MARTLAIANLQSTVAFADTSVVSIRSKLFGADTKHCSLRF
ncbi:hypothetical protein [Bradyrhizobium sp. LTSP885]|nr:hypothetical protein [Bradyrhizobium sp. LTSP885]